MSSAKNWNLTVFPKTQLKSNQHVITGRERKSETNHTGITFDHDSIGQSE